MVRKLFYGLLLAGLPLAARAQPQGGTGLRADYYEGMNFERLVQSRRDATIDFNWQYRPPAPGMPTEFFSVRWTGWLQVPTGGRYQFRAVVDDGMRIWLDDRLVLDEWRDQPVSRFAFALDLQANIPYKLRVEYYQNILDTRASLTWVLPPEATPAPAAWGILRGVASAPGQPTRIAPTYLYSEKPALPAAPEPPAPRPAPAPRPRPAVAATPAAAPVRPSAPRPQPAPTAPSAAPEISEISAARVERLSAGEAITLPELRFEQGEAALLPAARTALDGLAPALQARPALRLEVQGHTDNVGSAELNRQLSQRRAEAVCLYLMAHGVPAGQLRAVGYGGTRPVADNADPQQRPRNRRVMLLRL